MKICERDAEIPDSLLPDKEIILTWLIYKREKGQSYKPTGLKNLWDRLLEIPPDKRKKVLQKAMGNNWAGFFGGEDGTYQRNAGSGIKPKPGKYDALITDIEEVLK